jgi:hypothetical protein
MLATIHEVRVSIVRALLPCVLIEGKSVLCVSKPRPGGSVTA